MTFALDWLSSRMLGLQGPDRPWTILFGVRLNEPLARRRVEEAWARVCAARPDLAVTLGDDGRWHPTAPGPLVVGPVEPELDRPFAAGESMVRLVVDGDPTTTLRFVVNHGHADGMGVRGMADDLLRVLDGHEAASRDAMTDAHLDRLRSHRPALRAAWRQIPPRGLATLPAETQTVIDVVGVDRAAVDERRRSAGVSVSTLLIDATHRAITEFPLRSTGRVALGIPADVRRHVGDPTGIGNAVVNLTFAPRATPDLATIDHFLRTEATPRRLGETLAWIHRVGRPGRPRSTPRSGRAVATAMLSNLGLVDDGPWWDRAEMLELVAPAHQTTSVGFIALRDTLTVTVRSRGPKPGLAASIVSALVG